MCKEFYFSSLRLLRYRLRDLDITTYFFRHFISKTYFTYLRIFDIIVYLQQKRSFVVIFAITLLSILSN